MEEQPEWLPEPSRDAAVIRDKDPFEDRLVDLPPRDLVSVAVGGVEVAGVGQGCFEVPLDDFELEFEGAEPLFDVGEFAGDSILFAPQQIHWQRPGVVRLEELGALVESPALLRNEDLALGARVLAELGDPFHDHLLGLEAKVLAELDGCVVVEDRALDEVDHERSLFATPWVALPADDPTSSSSVAYTYDPLGRLQERATTGPTADNEYIYAGTSDTPIMVTDGAGTITQSFINGALGTRRVNNGPPLVSGTPNPNAELIYTDGIGNTAGTATTSATRTNSYTYDAFGAPDQSTPTNTLANLFLGKNQRPLDTETGLVLMRARAYDADTGRFLSTDPVEGGSANLYDYANQDPINQSDPDGTFLGESKLKAAIKTAKQAASWTENEVSTISGWKHHGESCTFSPNSIPGFGNYDDACADHDHCYSGVPLVARKACDETLRSEIRKACMQGDFGNGPMCDLISSSYYEGVQVPRLIPLPRSISTWQQERLLALHEPIGAEIRILVSITGKRSAVILAAGALSTLLVACGANNPGEPRSLAKKLASPAVGDVSVYCVGSKPPEVCDILLDGSGSATLSQSVAWWLDTARAARSIGVFSYQGSQWRWGDVILSRPYRGRSVEMGWRCATDSGLPARKVVTRMLARTPSRVAGIKSLEAAQKLRCHVGFVPE